MELFKTLSLLGPRLKLPRDTVKAANAGKDANGQTMTRALGIISTCISAPRAGASVCFLSTENVLLGFGKMLTRKPRILEICLF